MGNSTATDRSSLVLFDRVAQTRALLTCPVAPAQTADCASASSPAPGPTTNQRWTRAAPWLHRSLVAPAASPLVVLGIAGMAVVMALAFAALLARAGPVDEPRGARLRRMVLALGGAAVWMAVSAALALAGTLRRFDARPPPLALLMFAVVAGSIALGLSRVGRRVAEHVPLALLVGVQAFRLPLELVMHRAAAEGVMPQELTFGAGLNWDIATGSTAVVVALLAGAGKAPRRIVLAWNVMGFVMLAIIAAIAIGTAPFVRAFGDDPRHVNTWVAYFPYVWLPAVLVFFALFGHVVIARRLRRG